MSDITSSKYHCSSMPYNPKREIVWKQIVKYLTKYIHENHSVLELGAGYCHFINNVLSKNKYAIDIAYDVLQKYAGKDVQIISGNVLEIEKLMDRKVDVIFASNLFEHLHIDELHLLLSQIKDVLTDGGCLITLHPNYRYAYKEYFFDFTHVTVLDHDSMERLLKSHGFKIVKMEKKFLPFSMYSKLPVFGWLVYIYLRLPIKLFAKQMLVVASVSIP